MRKISTALIFTKTDARRVTLPLKTLFTQIIRPANLGLTIISVSSLGVAGNTLRLNERDQSLVELKNHARVQSLKFKNFSTNFSARTQENVTDSQSEQRIFIVQYLNPITKVDQDQLRQGGIEVLRYIPDDAYVVRATLEALERHKLNNDNVRDFVAYLPQIKVAPSFNAALSMSEVVYQTVLVQLFDGENADELATQVVMHGWLPMESSAKSLVVRLPKGDVQKLAELEGVEWISEAPRMELFVLNIEKDADAARATIRSSLSAGELAGISSDSAMPIAAAPDLTLTGYETGTKLMNFEDSWSNGFRGGSQVVGIADSGLDRGDVALLSKDFSGFKTGFAWGLASNTWADYVGHGTHVSGSIVDSGGQSNGKILGGAFEAKMVMQSLWSEKYKNITTPSDLGTIFKQAYEAGARVHSNSWGNPRSAGKYDIQASQVDDFIWNNPDMIVLFAAGNDGVDGNADGRIDPGSMSSPATSKNVISVGASENFVGKGGVQRKLGDIQLGPGKRPWPAEPIASDTLSDNPKGITAFSSRGPTRDGRVKPDVVAPGSNILSNCSKMKGAGELWGRVDDNYCYSGGTSMATPLTAAAALLIRQRLELNVNSPSAALVKAVMIHTATDLFPGQYGEVGEAKGQEILTRAPNSVEGYGLVNVGKATNSDFKFVDAKDGVSNGDYVYYDVDPELRKFTLVYTDAPGSPAAAQALVNDLQLEVQADTQNFSNANNRDNIEQVVIGSAQKFNKMRVLVKGISVPMDRNGKAPFALVFSK